MVTNNPINPTPNPTLVDPTVNSIVQAALAKAGVPSTNIGKDDNTGVSKVAQEGENAVLPNDRRLDGKLKGSTKDTGLTDESEELDPNAKPAKNESQSSPNKDKGDKEEKTPSTKEILDAFDKGLSRIQSVYDRRMNQIQQSINGISTIVTSITQKQEESDIASLPADQQLLRRIERLEKGKAPGQPQSNVNPQQSIDTQVPQFYQFLVNVADGLGIKIDDSRIDWAPDAADFKTGMGRFMSSLKAIQSEEFRKQASDLKKEADTEIQKVKNKVGYNRVATSGASGAGRPNLSNVSPMQKIRAGLLIDEELGNTNK